MDISNHISTLLKFNECVIIPDFGSFISNYVPSQFDTGRNAYIPPSKEIVFNSKITRNDGLLINHLVESESITYTQAYQAVSNWVSSAFELLDEGDKLEINEVGTLEYDRNGSFIFSSVTSSKVLAEAYGLEPVNFPRLVRPVYVTDYTPRPAIRAISNHKNIIRVAAAVALVLSLSLIPMKLKRDYRQVDVSSMNPFSSTAVSKPEQVVPENSKVVAVTPKQESPAPVSNPFVLVGGSFEIEANAVSYRDQLMNEGNHSEMMRMQNGRFRVTIDSYKSREDALNAMDKYRTSHPGSQVWVSIR